MDTEPEGELDMAAAQPLAPLDDGEQSSQAAPTRLRAYTRLYNDLTDDLMFYLSASAWKCLSFLNRHTTGWQNRPQVRLTIPQLCDGIRTTNGTILRGTGLSRNTVMTSLDELISYGIVGSDASQRTRTEVRSYWLTEPEQWNMDALRQTKADPFAPSTSPKIALVETASASIDLDVPASPNTELDQASSSPEIAPAVAKSSPKSAPLLKKEITKQSDQKEMPATQGAPAVASAPSSDREAPPKGWPKRTEGEDDLAFYRRALRLVNPPAGLAYIAHLHLGVPSRQPTIGRLGGTLNKLVKETDAGRRFGLVMQAILKAAATELDSDPLNYVERVAIGLANGAHQQRYGGGRFEPTPNGEMGRGKVRMSAAMRARRSTGAKPYWGVSDTQEGGAQ